MGEGEAAVDDEAALGLGGEAHGPTAGLVEVGQGRGVGDVEGGEAQVLEDELVGGALDGGEGEEGLGKEEGGVGRTGVGAVEEGGEEVGPDVALEVRIDEVAAVDGAADGGGGEVDGVGDGGGAGGRVEPFFGGESAVEAVGDDGCGVHFAAETGLD